LSHKSMYLGETLVDIFAFNWLHLFSDTKIYLKLLKQLSKTK
jgi:hypothetical protein